MMSSSSITAAVRPIHRAPTTFAWAPSTSSTARVISSHRCSAHHRRDSAGAQGRRRPRFAVLVIARLRAARRLPRGRCAHCLHAALPIRPARHHHGQPVAHPLSRLRRRSLGKYDRVIIFSQEQKRMLDEHGHGRRAHCRHPERRQRDDAFSPGPSTFKDDIGAETVITFLGRLDPEKNVGVLCECFQQLDPHRRPPSWSSSAPARGRPAAQPLSRR